MDLPRRQGNPDVLYARREQNSIIIYEEMEMRRRE